MVWIVSVLLTATAIAATRTPMWARYPPYRRRLRVATPQVDRAQPSPVAWPRPRAARTTSAMSTVPEKPASPRVSSGPQPRTPPTAASAASPTPTPAGMTKRSRIAAQLVAPQGKAGPTPSRNRRAAKNGALTRSNQGAPTLSRVPLTASATSG